jgi:lipoprotein NlpD
MRLPLAALLALTSACSSTLVDYEARVHVVQPGETLYTIAWRYGVDYHSLATWNKLRNPDLIYAGQRLRVTAPAASARSAAAASAPAAAATPTPTRTAARTAPRPSPPAQSAPGWQWPTRGPIVSEYGNSAAIASGIGIGGRAGQAISAAAAGRVVYAGSGLIGYGQLIIIKHNETYLSAYGHNSRLLVKQGQDVRGGEKIAEMGLGPRQQPRLHFEIRRNGVPVDPLLFLGSAG